MLQGRERAQAAQLVLALREQVRLGQEMLDLALQELLPLELAPLELLERLAVALQEAREQLVRTEALVAMPEVSSRAQ